MSKANGLTLTDAVGMGGVIAQDGFDYQVWETLLRLPAWLTNPAFEAVIFEGLEDIEARFFAPHAPEARLLERLQVKSGDLAPKDVKEVFERFLAFESTYPRLTRAHILVTPQLPSTLKWVARDILRVSRGRSFYAPFDSIRDASDEALTRRFVEEFGKELGPFTASGVEVTERSISSREGALSAFGTAFASAFPLTDVGPRKIKSAFDGLEGLVRRSKGVALSRRELADLLEAETNGALLPRGAFPIHIRSNRNAASDPALEIDAREFSDGVAGFPTPEQWQAKLVVPVERTTAWLRHHGVGRIALSGSYRLTTAFLLGHAFRSASGFEIEIPTRQGAWATDDRPTEDANNWRLVQPKELDGEILVVAVGVIRRPSEAIKAAGVATERVFDVFTSTAITGAKPAQAGVARIKAAVTEVALRLRAKRIDLYYAGPAAFAVALGHRWNAMLPTRLHEFDPVRSTYVPTALCS